MTTRSIDRSHLRNLPVPAGVPSVATEASQLGLAPGFWPDRIVVRGRDGRQVPFDFVHLQDDAHGDVLSALYAATLPDQTIWLRIFND